MRVGYERDDLSGLRDIRVSRPIIRLIASRLLPFKSGRRATIASSSTLAVAERSSWVARGLPSLLLDVASPTPHAGGAGPSLERGGVCSTHPRGVRLRRALVRGNLVISQRKMRQRTAVGVDSRVPALDLLNSSQRVSRSGSARLGPQKGGLPIHCGSSYHRFKAIDARLRGSRLPLTAPSNML